MWRCDTLQSWIQCNHRCNRQCHTTLRFNISWISREHLGLTKTNVEFDTSWPSLGRSGPRRWLLGLAVGRAVGSRGLVGARWSARTLMRYTRRWESSHRFLRIGSFTSIHWHQFVHVDPSTSLFIPWMASSRCRHFHRTHISSKTSRCEFLGAVRIAHVSVWISQSSYRSAHIACSYHSAHISVQKFRWNISVQTSWLGLDQVWYRVVCNVGSKVLKKIDRDPVQVRILMDYLGYRSWEESTEHSQWA